MSAHHVFSADPSRLDRERIHAWLSEGAYWALGRPRDVHEAAIAGSRNYGVYEADSGAQVAYARLVTDGATFGWLCDVIVEESVRGGGVGTLLLDGVRAELDALGLPRTILATADAHTLYARYGFAPLDDPTRWMIRRGTGPTTA